MQVDVVHGVHAQIRRRMFLQVLQMFGATPTGFVNAPVILQVVVLWTTEVCTAVINGCNWILGIPMSCCNAGKLVQLAAVPCTAIVMKCYFNGLGSTFE